MDARCILLALYVPRSGCQNHSIKSSLLNLPYLIDTETASTTWTSCDQPVQILLRGSNTGDEPNGELDMAGWFVPIGDLTRDDEDRHSHMSDIPLRLPASAYFPSSNSALVTFSQPEGDPMRNVRSLHPISSQERGESLATTASHYAPSEFTCSSLTSRNCSTGYTTSTRSSECSARRGSTCSASSTRIISRCYTSV